MPRRRPRDCDPMCARCPRLYKRYGKCFTSHAWAMLRPALGLVARGLRLGESSGPASSEASPFSRLRWAQRWPRCTPADRSETMDGSVDNGPIDTRSIKTIIGSLALIAAVAAAAGATMAAPLFGALCALSLSAAAGWTASLELLDLDRHRRVRAALWATLMAGWFALAAMLFSLPLLHLVGLRLVTSVLIVGGAALRVGHWRAQHERTALGLVVALAFGLLALAVTWSEGSSAVGHAAATAISAACAAELFATGSFSLGEFFASHRAAPNPAPGGRAFAAVQMAWQR